jgi:hypothetical protein
MDGNEKDIMNFVIQLHVSNDEREHKTTNIVFAVFSLSQKYFARNLQTFCHVCIPPRKNYFAVRHFRSM